MVGQAGKGPTQHGFHNIAAKTYRERLGYGQLVPQEGEFWPTAHAWTSFGTLTPGTAVAHVEWQQSFLRSLTGCLFVSPHIGGSVMSVSTTPTLHAQSIFLPTGQSGGARCSY